MKDNRHQAVSPDMTPGFTYQIPASLTPRGKDAFIERMDAFVADLAAEMNVAGGLQQIIGGEAGHAALVADLDRALDTDRGLAAIIADPVVRSAATDAVVRDRALHRRLRALRQISALDLDEATAPDARSVKVGRAIRQICRSSSADRLRLCSDQPHRWLDRVTQVLEDTRFSLSLLAPVGTQFDRAAGDEPTEALAFLRRARQQLPAIADALATGLGFAIDSPAIEMESAGARVRELDDAGDTADVAQTVLRTGLLATLEAAAQDADGGQDSRLIYIAAHGLADSGRPWRGRIEDEEFLSRALVLRNPAKDGPGYRKWLASVQQALEEFRALRAASTDDGSDVEYESTAREKVTVQLKEAVSRVEALLADCEVEAGQDRDELLEALRAEVTKTRGTAAEARKLLTEATKLRGGVFISSCISSSAATRLEQSTTARRTEDCLQELLLLAECARDSVATSCPSVARQAMGECEQLISELHLLRSALTDFSGENLQDLDLSGFTLDGVRWSKEPEDATLWPADYQIFAEERSYEVAPGVWEIREGGVVEFAGNCP